jgi:Mg2+-importing ATPase
MLRLSKRNGLRKGKTPHLWIDLTVRLLTQVLVVLMLRTQHIPLVQSRPSKVLGAALVIICVVGLVLPYVPPLSSALQMQRPHPTFYGFLVPILISYMLLVQLVKIVYRRVYKDWL